MIPLELAGLSLDEWGVIVGIVAGLLAIGGILLKVSRWVRHEIVDPLRYVWHLAESVHHNVVENGGKNDPPTFRDDVSRLSEDVSEARDDLAGLTRVALTNTRSIEEVRDELRTHTATGRDFVASAIKELADQGITVSINTDDRQHDEQGDNS